ncbi:MAG: hypothetical protein ABGW69_00145 [Nanoarchaeota archaeon]
MVSEFLYIIGLLLLLSLSSILFYNIQETPVLVSTQGYYYLDQLYTSCVFTDEEAQIIYTPEQIHSFKQCNDILISFTDENAQKLLEALCNVINPSQPVLMKLYKVDMVPKSSRDVFSFTYGKISKKEMIASYNCNGKITENLLCLNYTLPYNKFKENGYTKEYDLYILEMCVKE